MEALIPIVLQLVQTAITYIPKLIELEQDVAPLIADARAALAQIGTPTTETAEQFAALDAQVAGYEQQLQALADPPSP